MAPVEWYCPNCPVTHRTTDPRIATAFHRCAGVAGLTAPFLRAGVRGSVVAHEREDYIGTEHVQIDGNGRPVMSLITSRDDGQDVTVYAPTASLQASARLRGN